MTKLRKLITVLRLSTISSYRAPSAPGINWGVALNYFRKGESPMQHLYSFAKSFLGLACLVLFLGTGAALGQTGSSLFGDGFDKDVIIATNTTLDRDWYYHNLTIKSGYILNPGGFRIFVSGTLMMEDGARISRDGNDYDPIRKLYGSALIAGTLGGSG